MNLSVWAGLLVGSLVLGQDKVDILIQKGIALTINQDFEAARKVFRQVQTLERDNPAGYFFEAAALQAQMMDFESEAGEGDFFRLLDKTVKLAGKNIRKRQDAWDYFYLGSALCYKGFYLAKKKEWLSALQNAWNGVRALQKAVTIDSTLYDAYLGIGTYKYWRSRLTQWLHWLPVVPDEREKGMAMIRRALKKGKYSHYVALNNLAWILIDAGDFNDAIALSQQGLAKFPRSRYFLWTLAEAYLRGGYYAQAIDTYKRILSSISKENFTNHYNEIVCRLKMAQGYFQSRQFKEAIEQCNQILATPVEEEIKERAEKKVKMALTLKTRCEQKLLNH